VRPTRSGEPTGKVVAGDAIAWQRLTPLQFEEVVQGIVRAMGFLGVQHTAGPGDRGRDICAYLPLDVPGVQPGTRQWVFQCKHARTVTKFQIAAELANFLGLRIDTWVLVTTAMPSPQLRDWIEQISKAAPYPFHIQAWWREDIDRLTRLHARLLSLELPHAIVECLKLKDEPQPTTLAQLTAVNARCREAANASVERYARGKYIPKLYIARALHRDISRFHGNEPDLASRLKSDIVHAVSDLNNRFHKDIAGLSKLAASQPGLSQGPTKEQIRSAKLLLTESGAWIQVITELLGALSSSARDLSDVTFYVSDSKQLYFMRIVEQLVDALTHMPLCTTTVTSKSGPATIAFGVLSESTCTEYLSRLRSARDIVNEYRRPAVLVIDRAGGGKTNFLCDFSLRLASTQPVLLLFGKESVTPPNGLISAVQELLNSALGSGGASEDPLRELDSLTAAAGVFLNVFIDGINEHRRVQDLDQCIISFLHWITGHRVRVTMTCRDIYWAFFSSESFAPFLYHTYKDTLREYSEEEYLAALPLYLAHYKIHCTLADYAMAACQHPLLLRFFCEAHGSIGGPEVSLGLVRDIRLKELFNLYLTRKVSQIATRLGHRNADSIMTYLFKLIQYIFDRAVSSLMTTEIAEATGETDLSTDRSMCLSLLDEDIIIEEQPTEIVDLRRVTFVYEEFMEYVVARALLTVPSQFGIDTPTQIFRRLASLLGRWVNARGIAEYVGLMLVEEDFGATRSKGIEFMGYMARGDDIWPRAFWAVVGRCSEKSLRADLFDLFTYATSEFKTSSLLRATLESMARYSVAASERLAATLLWTVVTPGPLSWASFDAIASLTDQEAQHIGDELALRIRQRDFAPRTASIELRSLFRTVATYSDQRRKGAISHSQRLRGGLAHNEDGSLLIKVMCDVFPSYQPMLVNGLVSNDETIRVACADRVRHLTVGIGAVLKILSPVVTADIESAAGKQLEMSVAMLRKRTRRAVQGPSDPQ
jgi:hypothetical protein